METTIFPAPAVAEQLQGFVEVRMHYDHHVDELKENANKLQLDLLKSIGAPMYAVIDPKTKAILSEVGYTSEDGFLSFLRADGGE